MANLAASAVTTLESWMSGDVTGKRYMIKRVKIVTTGQGGLTNKIPASVLGFALISRSGNFVNNGQTAVVSSSPDKTQTLLLMAAGGNVGDQTDTLFGWVEGTPAAGTS